MKSIHRAWKISLLILILPCFAQADDAVTSAVKKVQQATDKVNAINNSAQSPPCPNGPGSCDQPLSNRCAELRAEPDKYDVAAQGAKNIRAAFDDALKEVGQGTMGDVALSWLRKRGVPVSKLSPEDCKKFEEQLYQMWFPPYDSGADARPAVQTPPAVSLIRPDSIKKCDDKLQTSDDFATNVKSQLAFVDQQQRILADMRASVDGMLQQQDPVQTFNAILDLCKNGGLSQPCKEEDVRPLKSWVMNDLSAQGSASTQDQPGNHQELARRLTEYYDRISVSKYDPVLTSTLTLKDNPAKIADLTNSVFEARSMLCSQYQTMYATSAQSQLLELQEELGASKPVIRNLEKSYFTDKNYSQLQPIVDDVEKRVNRLFLDKIAPASGLSSTQVDEISNKILNLPMSREQPVPDSLFTSSRTLPLQIFRYDPAKHPVTAPYDYGAFADDTLSAFTEINADYAPAMQFGTIKQHSRIEILPSLMTEIESSPEDLRAILAHEVGHMIGPEISAYNGFDLRESYQKLIGCFQKEFNLKLGQQDEAFADWISAQVNGAILAAIDDPVERDRQLNMMMKSYCYFETLRPTPFDDPHPDADLRLDFIFGRDPMIRKAMGDCPSVPHCTLQGESP